MIDISLTASEEARCCSHMIFPGLNKSSIEGVWHHIGSCASGKPGMPSPQSSGSFVGALLPIQCAGLWAELRSARPSSARYAATSFRPEVDVHRWIGVRDAGRDVGQRKGSLPKVERNGH